jgi:hypothetical protein
MCVSETVNDRTRDRKLEARRRVRKEHGIRPPG